MTKGQFDIQFRTKFHWNSQHSFPRLGLPGGAGQGMQRPSESLPPSDTPQYTPTIWFNMVSK